MYYRLCDVLGKHKGNLIEDFFSHYGKGYIMWAKASKCKETAWRGWELGWLSRQIWEVGIEPNVS